MVSLRAAIVLVVAASSVAVAFSRTPRTPKLIASIDRSAMANGD
jgi:hypothetical protein